MWWLAVQHVARACCLLHTGTKRSVEVGRCAFDDRPLHVQLLSRRRQGCSPNFIIGIGQPLCAGRARRPFAWFAGWDADSGHPKDPRVPGDTRRDGRRPPQQ